MMGPEDVKKIYEMCKDAKIIPVHMDSYLSLSLYNWKNEKICGRKQIER